ncbi:MAG: hypothetical protein J6U92_01265 [Clostridia bacterium]|nr:hypothetical protein [Clostridia bacterium]
MMEFDATKGKIEALAKTDDDKIAKAGKDYINETRKKIIKITETLLVPFNKFELEKIVVQIDSYLQSNGAKGRIIYSEISELIFSLPDDDVGNLLTNVESLLSYSLQNSKKLSDDCCKFVIKLYDHCNLANKQKNMSSKVESRAEEFISKKINDSMVDIDNKIISAGNKIDDFDKELKSKEKEYITILGIFASIVLAFVGGLVFSTSVLENIDAVSIYRLLLVIGLLAFVLINVIYLLVRFITEINGKPIKFRIWVYDIVVLVYLICVGITWIVLK